MSELTKEQQQYRADYYRKVVELDETILPFEYEEICDLTAVYPEKNTQSLVALNYCALGLGEAGEVQGKVKKVWRGDKTLEESREQIIDELGDVLWYATRAAKELGLTLSELMAWNAKKLLSRLERGVIKGEGDTR